MDGFAKSMRILTLMGDREILEKNVSPRRNGPDVEQLGILKTNFCL